MTQLRSSIIMALISISLFASWTAQSSEVVRLTSGEWPPYLSEGLPHGGFAEHVISEAYRAMGIEVETGHYPWKRSYKYALDGIDQNGKRWNGTMVWVRTTEREKEFYYSDPVIIDEEVLFHLKKFPLDWQTVDDLRGKVLGGTAHTAYPVFEKAQEQGILTLQRGGNYDTLLKRVFHQKIDAAPLVKYVGFHYLNESFTNLEQRKFTYAPTVIETRQYHLILTKADKSNEELVKIFNQGLKAIHKNGRYQQLVRGLRRGYYRKLNN